MYKIRIRAMRKQISFILVMVAIFLGAEISSGQENLSAEDLQQYLIKLESPDFPARAEAINFLCSYYKEREIPGFVFKKLINLLFDEAEKEKLFYSYANKPGMITDKVPRDLLYINSAEYAQYRLSLIRLAARSKEEKVLSLLVERWPDYLALANYGDLAVELIIDNINSGGKNRFSLVRVLRSFIKGGETPYKAEGKSREKIKATLKEMALRDEDSYVRICAIEALGESGDSDVIPLLEKIAATDNYKVELEAQSEDPSQPARKVIKYPAREAAKKELEKLKKGTHCP